MDRAHRIHRTKWLSRNDRAHRASVSFYRSNGTYRIFGPCWSSLYLNRPDRANWIYRTRWSHRTHRNCYGHYRFHRAYGGYRADWSNEYCYRGDGANRTEWANRSNIHSNWANRIYWMDRSNRIYRAHGGNRGDGSNWFHGPNGENRFNWIYWIYRINRIHRVDGGNRTNRYSRVLRTSWKYWALGIYRIYWSDVSGDRSNGTLRTHRSHR
jgi:hypothetical protein